MKIISDFLSTTLANTQLKFQTTMKSIQMDYKTYDEKKMK